MSRPIAGALFAAALIVTIVTLDLLFFRHHAWERLAANVGVALIFVAFFLRFRRPR